MKKTLDDSKGCCSTEDRWAERHGGLNKAGWLVGIADKELVRLRTPQSPAAKHGDFFMTQVVLKINDASRQSSKLNKLLGTISLSSMVELLASADLEANPRLSKQSRVTDDIEESLENEAEIFHFMTKGILVAASEVEELDRSRFRLEFEDSDLEGILDGGHNSLAVGRYILRYILDLEFGTEKAASVVKPLKTWSKFKEVWDQNLTLIREKKASLPDTRLPIEVIYPSGEDNGFEYFQEKVLTINAARNNNAQLTPETRANKKGYYDEIKENLDHELLNEVEWKANDGGRIKVRDLVALSLIPLSKFGFSATEQVKRSPTVLFSSKGQCVDIYDKLMEEEGIGLKKLKEISLKIVDPRAKNALAIMADLPRLYDLIYKLLPEAYNKAGGKFGKITQVEMPKNGKGFKTHFYRKATDFRYGDGYFYPLVYGLSVLMKVEEEKIKWVTDPDIFLKNNMATIMKSFSAMIAGVSFDPAKVGKSIHAYNLAGDLIAAAYKDEVLRAHGLND